MIISFDLDDTLICSDCNIPIEKKIKFPLNLFIKERLLKGIVNLYHELIKHDYKIFIYTTSARPISYIKFLFEIHGIKISKIINAKIHEKIVQRNRKQILPSKYPSRFSIDLHVDDDITVKQNGDIYGFKVIIIDQNDPNWTDKVLKKAIEIRKYKLKEIQ